MRYDLSWLAEPMLATAPFLPAGKGALILIFGGLTMLAITTLLARAMAGPPPKPVPRRGLRAPAPRRKTAVPVRRSTASALPRTKPMRVHGTRRRGARR